MKGKIEKQIQESMSKNPNKWRGIFYYNPKDPRIIVPKLNPMLGWTVNFSSPYAYITIIGIIVIVIASTYFF
ncbi:MAG TPA: hypothetical protein DDX39_03595 [Bacteroidales bacterium]|nr:MAG: hypothetical protein A2W98_12725 [Bacteroidetes bacterium GWF2_33_38]OFY70807.1 MAG: hypothetical protein A2265_08840 [Bacteroidetes bacterium RIFOXYA12_FULL_33_9]OFY90475.1 MAG: hypothetical protein A2236_10065 [Bacteroidetes bacterium RIFOXYA2_FULL_33_7]HBF87704.1 hypothetical protein [Bacteroidales bacterium]